MKTDNPDNFIYAARYDDCGLFHSFMKEFKSDPFVFCKYAEILSGKISDDKNFFDSFDFFIYVPASDSCRTNYSLKLAEIVSERTGKPLKNGIIKKIKITRELKRLQMELRPNEIEGSFAAFLSGGEKICVIDDVYASGATLGEISKTLKRAGAAYVCAAAAALFRPTSGREV
jgi:predicted amidophosphoribosyltransferase